MTMPKYRVKLTYTVAAVEAPSEDEAIEYAEEMLGVYTDVDAFDADVEELCE